MNKYLSSEEGVSGAVFDNEYEKLFVVIGSSNSTTTGSLLSTIYSSATISLEV
jgi:hypothetical protein